MYYKKYNRKKEMIKNIVISGFILFIAVFSTYNIYNKFSNPTEIDYSSESLDISFHEDAGEELDIIKVTPLTDAVGLSSMGHTLTITNNKKDAVRYRIKIVDNVEKMDAQNCKGITIPREEIRISIKKTGGATKIYKLSELKDGILLSSTAESASKEKYTIRIWVNNESSLPSGSSHHYHGLIQVVENDTMVAVK